MKVLGVEVKPSVEDKQRVLDVPAIDMTDAPTDQPARSQPSAASGGGGATAARRRGAADAKPKRAARRQAKSRKENLSSSGPSRRRDGSVARETFEAVERLVSGGAKKTDAFKQVAEESGRSAGTVATTYYRVAGNQASPSGKESGRGARAKTPRAKNQRRSSAAASTSRSRTTRGTDLDRLAGQMISTLSQLAEVVSQQSRELAELRARVDGIRQAVR